MTFLSSSESSHSRVIIRNWRHSLVFQYCLVIIISLILSSPVSLNSFGAPRPMPLTQEQVERTRAFLQKINSISDRLNEKVLNPIGISISRLETPTEISHLIDELEASFTEFGIETTLRPTQVRQIVLDSLQLLYTGRGHTQSKDKTGWYPIKKRGASGVPEFNNILNRGLLDSDGKKQLLEFIKTYDFDSENEKKKAGFPLQVQTHDNQIKTETLEAIEKAPMAEPYLPIRYLTGGAYNIEETLTRAVALKQITEYEARDFKAFLNSSLENNLFDKSIRTLNDPGKTFIDYFGRDEQERQLVNALSKLEKSHILLTGRAGVGKTTLLKMISDHFVQGKLKIRNEQPPMIFELPILSVATHDSTVIKNYIRSMEYLSRSLDRRIILYVDEAHIATSATKNTLKGFLTQMIEPLPENSKVHLIFATTSEESRSFLADRAFSRRFTEIDVPEFNREQTIQLMKQTYEPIWKKYHKKNGYEFDGISENAYEYAYRYASQEQPHAGNPTGTKELLEGAIVAKLNRYAGLISGQFMLEAPDLQTYIRDHLHIALVPGDPEFETKFQEKWSKFNEDYVGNQAAKLILEDAIRSHFGQINKNKMTAIVNFGPPGGGKSYGAEMIAKHFFDHAMLTINGAEFTAGGSASENKLIGSPTGYVGSEEQRAILTKFIKDNPQGGIIKIEEADYLHQDVIRLFTNMITDKKFMDGLGKEWETSRYILWMNSNLGQELMIPVDTKNRMNWEQFNTRRKQGTEKVIASDGREFERVKPELLDEVFEQFIQAIVTQSNPNGDTSLVSQEAQKQKRRYKAMYTLPPSREDLIAAAHARVARYIQDVQTDYGITLEVSSSDIERMIDLDHYRFEKGYSYVIDQLEDHLFRHIVAHLHERGNKIRIKLEKYTALVDGVEIPSLRLVITPEGKTSATYLLGAVDTFEKNPWGDSPEMMARIRSLSTRMHELGIRGNEDVIHRWKAQLKLKTSDWNTRTVFTLLGTSGNGKTERFKALAKALYDGEQAIFTISGITSKYDLSRFFRPPMGIQGGKEQTDLERWFLSRQKAGGGVILLDELLSFAGLTPIEIGSRLEAFNELYDLLDEGYIRFGSTRYDARGFVIGITGNSLQEFFNRIGDDPDTEQLVEKIRSKLGQKEVLDYFSRAGMDAPKVARLGIIDILGPQPRSVTLPVAKAKLAAAIEKMQKEGRRPIEITIDDSILQSLVERVTTAKLGMRQVNRAFDDWVKGPMNAIRADFPSARKIEMKLSSDQKTHWFVDGQEVGLEGVKLTESSPEERNWSYLSEFHTHSQNRTHQLEDLPSPQKLKYTPETLHAVATHELYGHWMTEVLLNRKNPADAISLIAGEGYLGFVRQTEEELYSVQDLSKLIKEQIMLQAGHRAVFLKGQYATGGGHGGSIRDPKEYPSDDIGKIDRLQEVIINNRLLPDLSETSNAEHKHLAKLFFNDLLDELADQIITEGMSSGDFKPLYDQLIDSKFLNKKELDQFVSTVDFNKYGSSEAYFLKHLRQAMRATLDRWRHKIGQKNQPLIKNLSQGILERVERESKIRSETHEITSGTSQTSASCTSVFDSLK